MTPSRTRVLWARLIALVAVLLLAYAQWVLTVAEWFGSTPPRGEPLRRLDEVLRATGLRLPPEGGWALILVALAMPLFALATRLAHAAPLCALNASPIPLVGFRALLRLQGLGLLLATGGALALVVRTARGGGTPPLLWLFSWAALSGLALLVDGANGRLDRALAKRAAYALAYAGSLAAIPLALAGLGASRFLLAAAFGLAGAAFLAVAARGSSWSRRELAARLALAALVGGSFLLLSYGLRSWAWAFLGDEFDFWNTAKEWFNGRIPAARTLSGQGTYGYHPILSSIWQALSMRLFGEDAYGWRVSHSILISLGAAPLFFLARRLLGTSSAFVGAGLYGASHVLLSVGRLGSNNAQVVLFLPLSLSLVALALESGLVASYVLSGLVLGLGFYTFGVAKVWSLVLAAFLLAALLRRPAAERRGLFVAGAFLVLAAAIVALPLLLDPSQWGDQAQHTFLKSESAHTPAAKAAQLARNTVHGFLAPLLNRGQGVWVAGPHADPLTGGLLVLGLAGLLGTWSARGGRREAGGLLAGFAVAVLLIAGIQQYSFPNITRTFALVPFYALLAACGHRMLVAVLAAGELRGSRREGPGPYALGALVLGVAAPVNVWLNVDLSQRKTGQSPVAFLLQTAELTRVGAASPRLYLALPQAYKAWPELLFPVYGVEKSRVRILSPREALSDASLCEPSQSAVFAVLVDETPHLRSILRRVAACWPQADLRLVKDGTGSAALYRFTTPRAAAVRRAIPGRWSEVPIDTATLPPEEPPQPWRVESPRALAAAADGRMAGVQRTSASVLILRPDGTPDRVLEDVFVNPTGVAFTPKGDLVVLDAGVPDGICWLDREGRVVSRAGSDHGIGAPQGIAAVDEESVWITDTGGARLLRVDRANRLQGELQAGKRLGQPSAIAVSADGRLAVVDGSHGNLFVFAKDGRVLHTLPIRPGQTADRAAQVAFLPNGFLLATDADAGRVVSYDALGKVVREWTGLQEPLALAVAPNGRILVASAVTGAVEEIRVEGESR